MAPSLRPSHKTWTSLTIKSIIHSLRWLQYLAMKIKYSNVYVENIANNKMLAALIWSSAFLLVFRVGRLFFLKPMVFRFNYNSFCMCVCMYLWTGVESTLLFWSSSMPVFCSAAPSHKQIYAPIFFLISLNFSIPPLLFVASLFM